MCVRISYAIQAISQRKQFYQLDPNLTMESDRATAELIGVLATRTSNEDDNAMPFDDMEESTTLRASAKSIRRHSYMPNLGPTGL